VLIDKGARTVCGWICRSWGHADAGESLAGKGSWEDHRDHDHTAKVLLITDSESSVAAKIQGSRAEGIVEGSSPGV